MSDLPYDPFRGQTPPQGQPQGEAPSQEPDLPETSYQEPDPARDFAQPPPFSQPPPTGSPGPVQGGYTPQGSYAPPGGFAPPPQNAPQSPFPPQGGMGTQPQYGQQGPAPRPAGGGSNTLAWVLGLGCLGASILGIVAVVILYNIGKAHPGSSTDRTTPASNSVSSTESAATASDSTSSSSATTAVDTTQSTANLKQLATAMLEFQQDNGKYPPMNSPESAKKALSAYIKSEKIFLEPGAQQPYQTNPFVSGKTPGEVGNLAQTPAFYEPVPAPDGSRRVVFVDGAVLAVPDSEWASLKEMLNVRIKTAASSGSPLSDGSSSGGSASTSDSSASGGSTPSSDTSKPESAGSSTTTASVSDQQSLQALVANNVSKFTLVKSEPSSSMAQKTGATSVVHAAYRSASGSPIEHYLFQWASYNSGDTFTNNVIKMFTDQGYEIIDKKPLKLKNGEEVGKQIWLRKGAVDIIIWSHRNRCFVAAGAKGDALDFYQHTPY